MRTKIRFLFSNILLVTLLIAGPMACSDDTAGSDTITPDSGTGDTIVDDDAVIPDAGPKNTVLSVVINSLTAPTDGTEFAMDLDSSGTPKNTIGTVFAALSALEIQDKLNYQMSKGIYLMLMEVKGNSLVDDTATTVQMYQGEDTDTDPSNNFSGTATLKIAETTPTDLTSDGVITSGALEVGPGKSALLVPLTDDGAILVTLKKAYIKATVASSGITEGILAGAISEDDLANSLLPAMATMITNIVKDPNHVWHDSLKNIFDPDNNDEVTAQDLQNNQLVSLLLTPDIDTDGDDVKDALSFGIGFTAVPCTIDSAE